MIDVLQRFLRVALGSVRDLSPILLVVVFFELVVLQQPFPNVGQLLVGLVLVEGCGR